MTISVTGTSSGRLAGIARRLADGLGLLAMPVLLVLAALVARDGSDMAGMAGMAEPSALGGMAGMYLVMAVFHAGPWLRLAGRKDFR
ncbi:hypothetical protein [Paradevosia shaoguanensis]|uniref:hypothetical protein n=1 Tax=Paradevosia shaoguanensis TaxID=1335043 RepID=UPI003C748BEF